MKRCGSGLVFWVFTLFALAVSAPRADNSPEARCAAAKLKAAGKAVDAVLACQAKGAITGLGDSTCFIRANLKLVDAFERAEERGGCGGDLTAIKAILKGAIDDTVFELLPETCTLQANMSGSVTCVQHPNLPECFDCALLHVDDFDHHRARYFCRCN